LSFRGIEDCRNFKNTITMPIMLGVDLRRIEDCRNFKNTQAIVERF
jgi:hypothetical protein